MSVPKVNNIGGTSAPGNVALQDTLTADKGLSAFLADLDYLIEPCLFDSETEITKIPLPPADTENPVTAVKEASKQGRGDEPPPLKKRCVEQFDLSYVTQELSQSSSCTYTMEHISEFVLSLLCIDGECPMRNLYQFLLNKTVPSQVRTELLDALFTTIFSSNQQILAFGLILAIVSLSDLDCQPSPMQIALICATKANDPCSVEKLFYRAKHKKILIGDAYMYGITIAIECYGGVLVEIFAQHGDLLSSEEMKAIVSMTMRSKNPKSLQSLICLIRHYRGDIVTKERWDNDWWLDFFRIAKEGGRVNQFMAMASMKEGMLSAIANTHDNLLILLREDVDGTLAFLEKLPDSIENKKLISCLFKVCSRDDEIFAKGCEWARKKKYGWCMSALLSERTDGKEWFNALMQWPTNANVRLMFVDLAQQSIHLEMVQDVIKNIYFLGGIQLITDILDTMKRSGNRRMDDLKSLIENLLSIEQSGQKKKLQPVAL